MANRYTNLFDAGIVEGPKYAPLPFQEIAAVGAAKQKRYDDTEEQLNKLDTTIKSIPYHDEFRDAYVKGFTNEAQKLQSSGIDFGSQEGRNAVSNLLYKYKTNPDLQVMNRSIDSFKKQNEEIADLKKKPGEYAYYNDPTLWDQKLYDMGANPYKDPKTGGPKEYMYRPVPVRENHEKGVEDIFNNIKDSGSFKAYAGFSPDQTSISEGGKGWEGVTQDTIDDIVNKNVGTYMSSAAGEDKLRKFHYDNAQELSTLSPEQIQQAEQQHIKNYMQNIADTYVHTKKNEKASLKTTKTFGADDASATPAAIQTFHGNREENPNVQSGLKGTPVDGVKFDEKGNAIVHTGDYKLVPPGPAGSPLEGAIPTTEVDKEATQKAKDYLNDYRKKSPDLANLSDADLTKAISDINTNMSKIHNDSYSMPNLDLRKKKEEFNSSVNGYGYMVQGDEKTGYGGMDNVAEKLGLSGKEFEKEVKAAEVGRISPANHGSLELKINDSKGQPQTVYARGSDQMQEHFAPATIAAEHEKKGEVGTFNDIPGVETNIRLTKDPQMGWHYQTLFTPLAPKEESDAFIKAKGKSIPELEKEGYEFNKDGQLKLKKDSFDPEALNKHLVSTWLNSEFEKPNRIKPHKEMESSETSNVE